MHPATELILARMASNPEEFAEREENGRWEHIINDLRDLADEDEWKIKIGRAHV